jgi:anti-sigma B factor antagonist
MTQGMNELLVESREVDDVVLVYPKGFINAHTVRLFEDELRRAFEKRRYKIVVNCAQLAYIASAGLGAIMGAIEEIRRNGGDLRLTDLNEAVLNIFEILGFTRLYRIYPTEVEAILSFRPGGSGS